MKLRIQVVLVFLLALPVTPVFWPDLGTARAQSERSSSENILQKSVPGPVQVDAIETVSGPFFTAWSVPEPVEALNTYAPELPSCISRDGLSLYLQLSDPVTLIDDVYVAHRPDLDAEWGTPVRLPATINTAGDERNAFVSADGLSLYFASDRPGGTGGHDLYVSRRTDVHDDSAWQPPENLSAVNSPGLDGAPALVEDASGVSQLYFHCDPEPGGVLERADIYMSILGPGGFEPPSRVAELSSVWSDRRPYLRHDGREIYFVSDRSGLYSIHRSVRSSTADPWSPPVVVIDPRDLGDSEITWATTPVLSWDGTTLYFGVYGPAYAGMDDVYVAHRARIHGRLDP